MDTYRTPCGLEDVMTEPTISVITAGDVQLPAGAPFDVVASVGNGHEAVATTLTEVPDVLVLDSRIDDPDARAVCRRIREWAPATRVLAAAEIDDENLYSTLVAGAAGAVGDAAPGEVTEGASACEKTSTCDKADGEACVCAKGKDGAPVWCASCKKGFVDGKEVCCPKCVQRAVDKAAAAGGTE